MGQGQDEFLSAFDIEAPSPSPPPVRSSGGGGVRRATSSRYMAGSIIKDVVAPTYVEEARQMIRGRGYWRRVGDGCESVSRVLAGIASVLAFSATSFDHKYLAFAAGCANTVGLVVLLFSNYAHKESRERTTQLNTILQAVGVTPMPYLTSSDSAGLGNDIPDFR